MKNNFKELLYSVLDIYQLINRLFSKDKSLENYSNKSKTYLTANDTLQLNSSVKLSAENIGKTAKTIMKQYINNPDDLLKLIESKGTRVIRAKHIEKLLRLTGEYDSFILPSKGLKALFLIIGINLLSKTKMKLALSTPAMFVLEDKPVNIYLIAHQFHHWMSYIEKMPGYEENTVNNFKNIWNHEFGSKDIDKLCVQEILALKDAIARDIEAINFVKEITNEYIASKTSSDKLKNGQSQSI
ncbi:MAG: hypothetical protein PHC34_00735 [Candidatus Gastranaerophilales bacterium]|nr:hypothetical protein [Candidatus Gastranaerophilales bacterium]